MKTAREEEQPQMKMIEEEEHPHMKMAGEEEHPHMKMAGVQILVAPIKKTFSHIRLSLAVVVSPRRESGSEHMVRLRTQTLDAYIISVTMKTPKGAKATGTKVTRVRSTRGKSTDPKETGAKDTEAGMVRNSTIIHPIEVQLVDLLRVHTQSYIDDLKKSITVARITQVPHVAHLPKCIVQSQVLRPLRFQTGGTVLAAKLALERGWAINLGGGFHHCSATQGGGFCVYADITIAIRLLFDNMIAIKRVMIIDLDAHQGNGYERDFMADDRVYILDMFNHEIYPNDEYAKGSIRRKVQLNSDVGDSEYLSLVRKHVEAALNEFPPDLIIYNAGTDVLEGDMLGHLSLSTQGVIERDQIVFQKARTRDIPIMMLTSGGYQRSTARVIANSILNLHSLGLITSGCRKSYRLDETRRIHEELEKLEQLDIIEDVAVDPTPWVSPIAAQPKPKKQSELHMC
ncbi:Histone deacetylase 11 [Lamellibrachia satsuma]|nr:Histone deacetylase 11 [Lamellibrachia satsuma]